MEKPTPAETRIAILEEEVARLKAMVEAEPEYVPVDPEELREQLRAKGMTVGTLTGPSILGTTDTINAGPPHPHPFRPKAGHDDLCADCGLERAIYLHSRRRKAPAR